MRVSPLALTLGLCACVGLTSAPAHGDAGPNAARTDDAGIPEPLALAPSAAAHWALSGQFRAEEPDGGWAIPRSTLAQGEPAWEPEFTARTTRGVVGMTAAGQPGLSALLGDEAVQPHAGELTVTRGQRTLRCEFAAPFECPGQLRIETRGDLMLACVPQYSRSNTACADLPFKELLLATSRKCVLIDFNRSTCHDLTVFDDARLLTRGRVELRAFRYGALRRAPKTLWDVAHLRNLECSLPATSWGPAAEIRAVARYDDGFALISASPLSMVMKDGPLLEDQESIGCKPDP